MSNLTNDDLMNEKTETKASSWNVNCVFCEQR